MLLALYPHTSAAARYSQSSSRVEHPSSPEALRAILAQVTKQQQKWQESGGPNYDVIFERVCVCRPEFFVPSRLTVRRGTIESATYLYEFERTLNVPIEKRVHSVADLFQKIINAAKAPVEYLNVDYDDSLGYPRRVEIHYSNLGDDGETLILRDLVLVRSPSNERIERTWPSPSAAGVQMTNDVFVEFRVVLKAGHAAHPPCSADVSEHE